MGTRFLSRLFGEGFWSKQKQRALLLLCCFLVSSPAKKSPTHTNGFFGLYQVGCRWYVDSWLAIVVVDSVSRDAGSHEIDILL
jgi:hypothetical protein